MDPDMIREVLSNKSGHVDKPKQSPLHKLLFTGLAYYSGEKWARHRRIINPAFHLEKLKVIQHSISLGVKSSKKAANFISYICLV